MIDNKKISEEQFKEGEMMADWTKDELNKVGNADELEISSLREDGKLRKAVTIWVVRIGEQIYVRSVRGDKGQWYRNALKRHEGRIQAGGVDKDVRFVEVTDPAVIDQVSQAYRAKYSKYSAQYWEPMVVPASEAATLRVEPR